MWPHTKLISILYRQPRVFYSTRAPTLHGARSSATLLVVGCALSFACTSLAHAQAAAARRRACERGNSAVCLDLGRAYRRGTELESSQSGRRARVSEEAQAQVRAAAAFRHACEQGDRIGCAELAVQMIYAVTLCETPYDPTHMLEPRFVFYRNPEREALELQWRELRECNATHAATEEEIRERESQIPASLLARYPESLEAWRSSGCGCPSDGERAEACPAVREEYNTMRAARRSEACEVMSTHLARSLRPAMDIRASDPSSYFSEVLLSSAIPERLQLNCENGDARSCLSLAEALHAYAVFRPRLSGGGLFSFEIRLVAPDATRAAELLARACETGSADACQQFVQNLRVPSSRYDNDPDGALLRATAIYERMCSSGSQLSSATGVLGTSTTDALSRLDSCEELTRYRALCQERCDAGQSGYCEAGTVAASQRERVARQETARLERAAREAAERAAASRRATAAREAREARHAECLRRCHSDAVSCERVCASMR